MNRIFSCAALLLAVTLGLNAQKPMNAPKGGKAISDELIGIFFEDISSSAEIVCRTRTERLIRVQSR